MPNPFSIIASSGIMRLNSPGMNSNTRFVRNTKPPVCAPPSCATNSMLCNMIVLNICQTSVKSSGKSGLRSTTWHSPIVSTTSSKNYILLRRRCISTTKNRCAPKIWKSCARQSAINARLFRHQDHNLRRGGKPLLKFGKKSSGESSSKSATTTAAKDSDIDGKLGVGNGRTRKLD